MVSVHMENTQSNANLKPHEIIEHKRQLMEAERYITSELRGPLNDMERALLVADRKDIRDELAAMEASEVSA